MCVDSVQYVKVVGSVHWSHDTLDRVSEHNVNMAAPPGAKDDQRRHPLVCTSVYYIRMA